MRIMRRTRGLGALIAAGLFLSNGTLSAANTPTVSVNAVVKDGNVQIEVEANGPFEYTTYRPSASLYVINLSGVTAADPVGVHVVASNLVKSYQVSSFAAGDKPEVCVEILLKEGVEPHLQRKGNQNLTLLVSRAENGSTSAQSTPSSAAAPIVQAMAKPPAAKNRGASIGAIQQVRLAQNGGATEVSIYGSGQLTYHALHLQDPDRLVLDFAGSHLNTSYNHIASNLDPVRAIRLGQFSPETSRIVIDLSQLVRYTIKSDGSTVTVTLSSHP